MHDNTSYRAARNNIVSSSIYGIMYFMKDEIKEFDKFLYERGLKFEAIVIGGAALNIMDIVSRKTKDVDLIDPKIPEEIKNASIEFSKRKPEIDHNWLNNGPISIIKNLPRDWRQTLEIIFEGNALTLRTLSRINLIRTKLFAFCDRQIDKGDCIALSPTEDELSLAIEWVILQDANEQWPSHVKEMINELKKEL